MFRGRSRVGCSLRLNRLMRWAHPATIRAWLSTLVGMDRVRLGRVLGYGARMAARTVVEAVDAATTATPATNRRLPAANPTSETARSSTRTPGQAAPAPRSAVAQAVQTAGRVQGGARAARRGVLEPVKRASRAVSLEIAGSFFALFALSFGAAAWRFRGLASRGEAAQRLWIYLGFAALFAYFACSSFLRARRLSRS